LEHLFGRADLRGLMIGELHTQRGKWSEATVPHKGWSCVGVDDLEEPSQVCEMCESVDIRYVHYMEHPDYPATLAVGCVCAEWADGQTDHPRSIMVHPAAVTL